MIDNLAEASIFGQRFSILDTFFFVSMSTATSLSLLFPNRRLAGTLAAKMQYILGTRIIYPTLRDEAAKDGAPGLSIPSEELLV